MLTAPRKLSTFTALLGQIENGTVIVMGKQACRAAEVNPEQDSFALIPVSWDSIENSADAR